MTEKLEHDAQRGAKARALIDDELLREAFTELEVAYVEKWRTTPALDKDTREMLFLAVNVIGKVKEHLARVLADGRLAQSEIEFMSLRKAG